MGTEKLGSSSPYIQYSVSPTVQFSSMDLTNPEAMDWFAQVGIFICHTLMSMPRTLMNILFYLHFVSVTRQI